MKLSIDNLQKVKELCKANPNEVIDIDGIAFCWVISESIGIGVHIKEGCFRASFANGWETLYL